MRGGGVVAEKPFLVVYGGGLQKPLEVGFHFNTKTRETGRGRCGKERKVGVCVFFDGRRT
jgi:hypothetical protein